MEITIYTDGACKLNPGPGGWAYNAEVKIDGKVMKDIAVSGYSDSTTNNEMELTTVVKALQSLNGRRTVTIFSDSAYVINGATEWINSWRCNGWVNSKKKEIENLGLWKQLDRLMHIHNVEFVKVKAHSGIRRNELVDNFASSAAMQRKGITQVFCDKFKKGK